jgi:hypothetical protein
MSKCDKCDCFDASDAGFHLAFLHSEVERLKEERDSHKRGTDNCYALSGGVIVPTQEYLDRMDDIRALESDNTALRKVVEAARKEQEKHEVFRATEMLPCECPCNLCIAGREYDGRGK